MQTKKLFTRPIAVIMAIIMLAAIVSGPAHAVGGGRGAPPNLGMVDSDWDFDPYWDVIIEMNGLVLHEEREN